VLAATSAEAIVPGVETNVPEVEAVVVPGVETNVPEVEAVVSGV
jgi:hypothetical protein